MGRKTLQTSKPKSAAKDSEYWRQRATEAREMAKFISLADARRRMEVIADEYERRAERPAGVLGKESQI